MDTDGSIPVSSVGTLPNTSFRLSSQYLLQAVSSLDGDEVKVSFFVSTSPVVISVLADSTQEEIMMPMILH
jgi:DNA polymerase III sliding clamp (beta) subunit (PCNA family)